MINRLEHNNCYAPYRDINSLDFFVFIEHDNKLRGRKKYYKNIIKLQFLHSEMEITYRM